MNRESSDPVLRRWMRAVGASHFLLGSVVIAGRFGGWPGLVTIFPTGAPMAFTAAAAFLISGCAFLAHAGGRTTVGRTFGLLLTVLGGTHVLLYLLAEPLGISTFVIGSNVRGAGIRFDGRMSPNAAASMSVTGIALFLMGLRTHWARTLMMISSVLLAISFMALCGYATGLRETFSWWWYTGMALHTAIGVMLGASGILVWALRRIPKEDRDVVRSLPFFATAVGLVVVLGVVSSVSDTSQHDRVKSVQHTWEVKANIEHLASALNEAEAGARIYLLTDDATSRDDFESGRVDVETTLTGLFRLAADNPVQTMRLKEIEPLVLTTFLEHDAQIQLKKSSERARTLQLMNPASIEREKKIDALLSALQTEENRLLVERESATAAAEESKQRVWLSGVAFSTVLIVAAFILAHRAQRGLHRANASLEQRVEARTREIESARERLHERDRSIQFLSDSMPQLVWTTRVDGSIESINRKWEEYTGVPHADLLRDNMANIVHPDDVVITGDRIAAMLRDGADQSGELRLRSRDGAFRWHLWRGRPEFAKDGTINRFVGTSTDIHEQKQAGALLELKVEERTRELREIRASLEEAYHFQSAVLDSTSFGLIVTSPADGIIRIFNAGAERMLGWKREEVVGKHKTSLIYDHEEVAARAVKLSARLGREIKPGREVFIAPVEAGVAVEDEWNFVRKNGTKVPTLFNMRSLQGASGEITGFLGMLYDLTERKAAEAARGESEQRMRLFARHAPASVAMFDREMRYLVVSQQWLVDYNLEGQDLIGRCHYDVFPEIGQSWRDTHARSLAGAVERNDADLFTRQDGSRQWLQWEVRPWHHVSGEIGGIVMFTHDITERKVLETNLALARDQALEGSRLKSEFLATMSHEIRTPMNGVMGMMSLMMDTPLSSEQQEMARVIQSSASSLLTIINDILDFSKIEAGQMRIDPVDFDLRQVVEGTVALLEPRAVERELQLGCEVEPILPGNFRGDAGRIRQVLVNLVGNAVKFTERGRVWVEAKQLEVADEVTWVRFGVRDTGIGIPAEARDRLFQPFTQVDGTVTRRFGGTGLGLAISRQLVHLLGGKIELESELGQGSYFWFDLPLARPAGAEVHRVAPVATRTPAAESSAALSKVSSPTVDRVSPSARALNLLLAEDNLANRTVARMMLRKMGHTVEMVTDGQQALDQLAKKSYDAVLMDCQMPELDGYEATRRIRSGLVAGVDAKVPIIALTAYAMADDRDKCLTAGMNAYVTKPVSIGELHDAFVSCGLIKAQRMGTAPAFEFKSTVTSNSAPMVLDLKVVEMVRALPGRSGPSLWPEMVELFLREETKSMAEIQRFAAEGDQAALAAAAHRFAGSSVSVGAVPVQQSSLALERAAKNRNALAVATHLAELTTASRVLRETLQSHRIVTR